MNCEEFAASAWMFDENVDRRRRPSGRSAFSFQYRDREPTHSSGSSRALSARAGNLRQHSSNIQLFPANTWRSIRNEMSKFRRWGRPSVRRRQQTSYKEFGVWCVVGSPVWKPRDVLSEGAAASTLPRPQRPAPRAPHLSASRKSLAPDHRH